MIKRWFRRQLNAVLADEAHQTVNSFANEHLDRLSHDLLRGLVVADIDRLVTRHIPTEQRALIKEAVAETVQGLLTLDVWQTRIKTAVDLEIKRLYSPHQKTTADAIHKAVREAVSMRLWAKYSGDLNRAADQGLGAKLDEIVDQLHHEMTV